MAPVVRYSIVVSAMIASFCATSTSFAREAFLCGPQEILYVEASELEHMKKTNACVASHYGLEIETPKRAPIKVEEPPQDRPPVNAPVQTSKSSPPPLPIAKKTQLERKQRPHFRTLSEAPRKTQSPATVAALEEQKRSTPAAKPSPGTDFRNVHVLNAQSEDDKWYRHKR